MEAEGYEFEVADASFELLIRRLLGKHTPLFKLKEYHCSLRRQGTSTKSCEATVKLSINGKTEYTVAEGDGPVNALDLALRKALIPTYPWIADIALKDYKVRIIDGTQGTAAKTRVLIESSAGKLRWCTVGCDANTIEASWKAIVDSFEYYSLNSPQNKCE